MATFLDPILLQLIHSCVFKWTWFMKKFNLKILITSIKAFESRTKLKNLYDDIPQNLIHDYTQCNGY